MQWFEDKSILYLLSDSRLTRRLTWLTITKLVRRLGRGRWACLGSRRAGRGGRRADAGRWSSQPHPWICMTWAGETGWSWAKAKVEAAGVEAVAGCPCFAGGVVGAGGVNEVDSTGAGLVATHPWPCPDSSWRRESHQLVASSTSCRLQCGNSCCRRMTTKSRYSATSQVQWNRYLYWKLSE